MPCLAAVKPMIVPPRPALADGRVRHVGDPVAFVVADSAEAAREAAELIEVDYEALAAVVDGLAALAAGAPAIWPEAPGNLAYHVQRGDADAVAKAMAEAAHIVEIEVMNNRVIVTPIEPRAGIARYDAATGTMDLELTGQGVHGIRRQLAEFVFKLPLERIRVHAPDVGGGFGMKNFLYPEWILLLFAARKLGRPVRWLADRAEEFVMGAQGRDIAATAKLGARRRRPPPGARRDDGRQSRRLSLGQRAGRLGGRRLDGAGRRLRHPGDRRRRARRLHQHRAGRCLSRRRQARGQLHHRARHRGGGAQARPRSRRAAPAEPDRVVPAQDGARHGDRLGRLRRQSRCRRGARRRQRASPRGAQRPRRAAGCAASASPASSKPRAARPTKAPRCASRATARSWSRSARSPTARATRPPSPRSRPTGSACRSRRSATSRPTPRQVKSGAGHGGARSMHMGGAAVVKAIDATLAKARTLAAHLLQASEGELVFADGRFAVQGSDRAHRPAGAGAERGGSGQPAGRHDDRAWACT